MGQVVEIHLCVFVSKKETHRERMRKILSLSLVVIN